jgi:two-component system sensor histidine kinase EvgS
MLPDLATLQQRFGSRAVAEQLRDSLLQASEVTWPPCSARCRPATVRLRRCTCIARPAARGGGATALAAQANALVERLQDAAETDPAPLFAAVAAFVARLQQQLQRLAH